MTSDTSVPLKAWAGSAEGSSLQRFLQLLKAPGKEGCIFMSNICAACTSTYTTEEMQPEAARLGCREHDRCL